MFQILINEDDKNTEIKNFFSNGFQIMRKNLYRIHGYPEQSKVLLAKKSELYITNFLNVAYQCTV